MRGIKRMPKLEIIADFTVSAVNNYFKQERKKKEVEKDFNDSVLAKLIKKLYQRQGASAIRRAIIHCYGTADTEEELEKLQDKNKILGEYINNRSLLLKELKSLQEGAIRPSLVKKGVPHKTNELIKSWFSEKCKILEIELKSLKLSENVLEKSKALEKVFERLKLIEKELEIRYLSTNKIAEISNALELAYVKTEKLIDRTPNPLSLLVDKFADLNLEKRIQYIVEKCKRLLIRESLKREIRLSRKNGC